MKSAPIKNNEAARLAALRQYDILDTPTEAEFDDFTRLASQICGTPIALISLVDDKRQWFKSRHGIDVPETPRDISFCGHAIHEQEIFEIPNALEDERFRDNPLVTSDPNIRFYAGAPLRTSDGHGIGTLCVIDSVPHKLTEAQRDALTILSRLVIRRLELRDAINRESRLNEELNRLTTRLEIATHTARVGIWDYEVDSNSLVWDETMYRIYGIQETDFDNTFDAWKSSLHPDDQARKTQEFTDFLNGKDDFESEFRIVWPDGQLRWIKASAVVQRNEHNVPLHISGTNWDITDSKLVERASRESAQHTQIILDNVIDGIITIDSQGIVQSFNLAAEHIFGYTAQEVIGNNVKMLMPEPYHSEHDGYLTNYHATNMRRIIGIGREVAGLRKDGMTFPMDLAVSRSAHRGEPLFIGLVRDITERKQADTQLQALTAMRKAILDSANFSIISTDPDGVIQTFNQSAERMLGYAAEELVGKQTPAILHDLDEVVTHAKVLSRELGQTIEPGFETFVAKARLGVPDEHEWTYIRKDGSRFPILLSVTAVWGAQGEISGFLGIGSDITERKRLDQLKSEFVSTVSHELRTPLTAISGALGLIVSGTLGEMPVQSRQMLDIAHKNSLRLAHLINDLLDMEKLAAGKMRFDLQVQPLMPLVELALETVRAYGAQYQVDFVLTERVDGIQVQVDAGRLQQVLNNLLSNAAKFSPPGNTVKVAVSRCADSVRIEVTDCGHGIPEKFRARIFQKFAQADSSDTRQNSGTGLGLAISKEIIERMNGSIGFDSTEGQGARFYFELPYWQTPAPQLEVRIMPSCAPRLLVVEDEPDIARLLATMLNASNYQVDIAYDGATALNHLAHNKYDAMTLDLMLPDQSGVALIRQIRNTDATRDLPIIVISAQIEDGKLAINSDFKAIDWLEKPINENQLITTVANFLPRQGSARPRVLHVEDESDLHHIVAAIGHDFADFDIAHSLAEARNRLAQEHYNLVILDISLPDGSGWELLPYLKTLQPEPPIIVLSGTELSHTQQSMVQAALIKARTSNEDLLNTLKCLLADQISSQERQ
ncbi:MAG: PAS domain S-box protein [Pseudomonadota bacterium]